MKRTDEAKAIISKKSKLTWATHKAFGLGLMSEAARQRSSDRMSLMMAQSKNANAYSRCAYGRRDDLGGSFFRSSWEANYARYLNLLKKMGIVECWEYEPRTFWFEEIKRGVRSYRPDFIVKYKSDPIAIYVEIKGWMTDKDKTKLSRMKKYYPDIKLELVGDKQYRSIRSRWASAIPNWEGKQ